MWTEADKRRRILVVEDDPDNRDVVVELLRSDGYLVDAFGDGAEAYAAILAGERPDLLVIDLVLPGLGGDQLIEALRGHDELAGIPVVVVSASGAHVRGAAAVVRKPFDIGDLLGTIGRHWPVRAKVPE